jgi:hypothetical protein
MSGRRRAVTAGLLLSAPLAFLGLVLLPVGLLLQIGAQSALRVENRSGADLRVTPIGASRKDGRIAVLPQAVSNLLPLPALRGAEIAVRDGESRTIVYKRSEVRPTALAVRDGSGRLLQQPVADRASVAIGRLESLPPAPPEVEALAASSPQLPRWGVVGAGALGLASFLQLLRLRRRWEIRGE